MWSISKKGMAQTATRQILLVGIVALTLCPVAIWHPANY